MATLPQWLSTANFPIDSDLLALVQYLTRQDIVSKVVETDGQQELLIADPSRLDDALHYIEQWRQGSLDLDSATRSTQARQTEQSSAANSIPWVVLLKAMPITVIMIILGLVGAGLVELDRGNLSYAEPFLFQPLYFGQILPAAEGLANGQYWRLITPMFLHFGLLHIVFNSVLIWSIGQRIEIAKGSVHMLLVFLVTGLVANLVQYFTSPNEIFGGLSGAAYGLVGYIAIYQRSIRHPVLQYHEPTLLFLLVWLALGLTGVIDAFMSGGIANGAHVGGLLAGLGIGFIVAMLDQKSDKQSL